MTEQNTLEQNTLGRHAFAGACDPTTNRPHSQFTTFSVGIFPWMAKRSGGLKRGKVVVRVYGDIGMAHKVHEKAAEICKALDAGTYEGPKRVNV